MSGVALSLGLSVAAFSATAAPLLALIDFLLGRFFVGLYVAALGLVAAAALACLPEEDGEDLDARLRRGSVLEMK